MASSNIVRLAFCLFSIMQIVSGDQSSNVDDLYKTTQDLIQNLGKQLKDRGLLSQDLENNKVVGEVKAAFQKAGDGLVEAVKKLDSGKPISAEVQKNVEASTKIANDLVKQLKETDLKNAQKVYDVFANGAKKLSDQVLEISKSQPIKDVTPTKIHSAALEILEDITKVSQKVQSKVSEIVADQIKKQ